MKNLLKKAKKNCGYILGIVCISCAVVGFEKVKDISAEFVYSRELYRPVIEEYIDIVEDGFRNYYGFYNENRRSEYFNWPFYCSDISKYGIQFRDLNHDGIEELLISILSPVGGGTEGVFLFGLTKEGMPAYIYDNGLGRWGWYIGNDKDILVLYGSGGGGAGRLSYVDLRDIEKKHNEIEYIYAGAIGLQSLGEIQLTTTSPDGLTRITYVTEAEKKVLEMLPKRDLGIYVDDFTRIETLMNPSSDIWNFVERLYDRVLSRSGDYDGLMYHSRNLAAEMVTGSQTAYNFILSQEFSDKNVSDEEYVVILYNTLMNRKVDDAGQMFWLNELSSGKSRLYVFNAFVHSLEFDNICKSYGILRGTESFLEPRDQNEEVTAFVKRFYKECLNREADIDGLNYWCKELLRSNLTGQDTARHFINSQEFMDRNLLDTDLLKIFYRTFFDREPDTLGMGYWINRLDSGLSKEDLLIAFSNSAEFKEICSDYGIKHS